MVAPPKEPGPEERRARELGAQVRQGLLTCPECAKSVTMCKKHEQATIDLWNLS